MGEQYRQTIEDKIIELGAENLLVFINADGVNPYYRQHLEDTFRDAGVRFVSSREEANLIFHQCDLRVQLQNRRDAGTEAVVIALARKNKAPPLLDRAFS